MWPLLLPCLAGMLAVLALGPARLGPGDAPAAALRLAQPTATPTASPAPDLTITLLAAPDSVPTGGR